MADVFDKKTFNEKVREALLEIFKEPFDHEFRNELAKAALKDWYNVPEETKSALLSYVEQSNIQLPISQITGNFLVEDTTADLGGNIHGRTGMVANDDNYFQLTYDANIGKWVSSFIVTNAQLMIDYGDGGFGFRTSSTDYFPISNATHCLIPWESFDRAGLKPQFRLCGLISAINGGTASASMRFGTVTSSGIGTTQTASWAIETTGDEFKDSGWQDIPFTTATSRLASRIVLKTTSGSSQASIHGATALMRWISK